MKINNILNVLVMSLALLTTCNAQDFQGIFTIVPVHGDPFAIKSVSGNENSSTVTYVDTDGKMGFIDRSNIKNFYELWAYAKSEGRPDVRSQMLELGRKQDQLEIEAKQRKMDLDAELEEMRTQHVRKVGQ